MVAGGVLLLFLAGAVTGADSVGCTGAAGGAVGGAAIVGCAGAPTGADAGAAAVAPLEEPVLVAYQVCTP